MVEEICKEKGNISSSEKGLTSTYECFGYD
jgi:hypothetical protein